MATGKASFAADCAERLLAKGEGSSPAAFAPAKLSECDGMRIFPAHRYSIPKALKTSKIGSNFMLDIGVYVKYTGYVMELSKRGEPAVVDNRDYGEGATAPVCAESEQLGALLLVAKQAGKSASTILSPLCRPEALE